MKFQKRTLKPCSNCNKLINSTSDNEQNFCSKVCLDEFMSVNKEKKQNIPITFINFKKCVICENDFNENRMVIKNNKFICENCNKGLSYFNNVTLLNNLINFLEN